MISHHAKRLRMSAAAFKKLGPALAEMKYTPKGRTGFIIDQASSIRLEGRYFFERMQKIRSVDPANLEPVVEEASVLSVCTFAINMRHQLIRCRERRADLAVLEEQFGGVEGVGLELEDFNTDPIEVFKALRDAHAKVKLRSIKIKDYQGRENIVGTANFKVMDEAAEDDLFRLYREECQGITATVMTDQGKQQITVTRKGAVRHSPDLQEDVVELALSLLQQFHEDSIAESVTM